MPNNMKVMKASGSKRGFGACGNCMKEYSNRSKPEFCECGNSLGGTHQPKVKKEKIASSVKLYDNGTTIISSVRVSPNDDRNFVFVSEDERICHVQKCLELRSAFITSDKLDEFTCRHISEAPCSPLYCLSFSNIEIEEFTPDKDIQGRMKKLQKEGFHTVIKVSPKSYAVKEDVSSTVPLGFVHVMECLSSNGKIFLKCSAKSCRKRISNSKRQVSSLHIIFRCYFQKKLLSVLVINMYLLTQENNLDFLWLYFIFTNW